MTANPGRKTFPKEKDGKQRDTIQQLKSQVRKLKKIVKNQNNEIDQLETALAKNFEQISDLMGNLSIEQAIDLAKKKNHVAKPKEDTKEMIRERFTKQFGGSIED